MRLCEDGKDVLNVRDCNGANGIIVRLWIGCMWNLIDREQTFVQVFQSRTPQPSIYMRCLLQALICNDQEILGKMSIKQLIFRDLAEAVLPASILIDELNDNVEVPQDPRFQIAERMEAVIARVGQVSSEMVVVTSRLKGFASHGLKSSEHSI